MTPGGDDDLIPIDLDLGTAVIQPRDGRVVLADGRYVVTVSQGHEMGAEEALRRWRAFGRAVLAVADPEVAAELSDLPRTLGR